MRSLHISPQLPLLCDKKTVAWSEMRPGQESLNPKPKDRQEGGRHQRNKGCLEKPRDRAPEMSFGELLRCGQEIAPPEIESGELDCKCFLEMTQMLEANTVVPTMVASGKAYLGSCLRKGC